MIVDSHTHILPPDVVSDMPKFMSRDKTLCNLFRNGSRVSTAETLLNSMNQNKIDYSIVMGMGWSDYSFNQYVNEYLIESQVNSGGRLVAITGITPQHGDTGIYEAERCIASGSHGFGEVHLSEQRMAGKPFDFLKPYMSMLLTEEFPLVVHSSEPVGHLYKGKGQTNPQELEKLVQFFPNNKMVLAHWGGGLLFYEMMKEMKELMVNVFYDTAATQLLYNYKIFNVALEIVGANKILSGSDYPLLKQKTIFEPINNNDVGSREKLSMLGEVAASVFKINIK